MQFFYSIDIFPELDIKNNPATVDSKIKFSHDISDYLNITFYAKWIDGEAIPLKFMQLTNQWHAISATSFFFILKRAVGIEDWLSDL